VRGGHPFKVVISGGKWSVLIRPIKTLAWSLVEFRPPRHVWPTSEGMRVVSLLKLDPRPSGLRWSVMYFRSRDCYLQRGIMLRTFKTASLRFEHPPSSDPIKQLGKKHVLMVKTWPHLKCFSLSARDGRSDVEMSPHPRVLESA
jgi:hypothetical protein